MGKFILLLTLVLLSLFRVFAQDDYYNQSDTSIHLNEVVVNAYHINTRQHYVPGAISVLSGIELQTTDGNNFAHTVNSIPGIFMHSGTYATSRIVIRGMGSRTPYNTNRIKSYLNDIPITSSDGISTPEDLDLMGVDRMEVVKGPASALYGSGLGGNINLYTPKSIKNNSEAIIQYGNFNTIKAAAAGSYKRDNFNVWGNLSHLHSDGYRENNRHSRTSILSSGLWSKQRYSLEYTLLLMDLNAQIPSSVGKTEYETNPKAAAGNWKEVEGYKSYQRVIGGVTLANRLAESWSNKFTLFGRWADSYERRPFNNLDDGTSGGGIRNRLTFNSSHWDALIGFEWINDTYIWKMDLDGELINKNREIRNHYNLFGLAYWQPNPNWNISLGGALNKVNYQLIDKFLEDGDRSGSREFPSIFSPRFGVNYAPNRMIAFYGSLGHGFSMPSPEETLLPEGDINENLKPEQGIQYELGSRFNLFNGATSLEATFYNINLTNLLVTKRITEEIFTGINAGRTKHRGLELMLKQKLFRYTSFPGSMILNANYTFSLNHFVEFTDNEEVFDGNKLPGIPSQMAQANILWQPNQRLSLNALLQFVGEQFIDDQNLNINDRYFLTNLRVSYYFPLTKFGGIKLFVGVNNLLDTHYSPMLTVNAVAFGNVEPRYYYPGLPRYYYMGIRFNLNS